MKRKTKKKKYNRNRKVTIEHDNNEKTKIKFPEIEENCSSRKKNLNPNIQKDKYRSSLIVSHLTDEMTADQAAEAIRLRFNCLSLPSLRDEKEESDSSSYIYTDDVERIRTMEVSIKKISKTCYDAKHFYVF